MNYNSNNGRVNLNYPDISVKFSMMDKTPIENKSFLNSLTGIYEKNILSNAYFSNENIQIIQNAIRKGVYDKSNQQYIIDNQNVEHLVSIMRQNYISNSKNLDNNIQQQIAVLNKNVIDHCINNVYNEVVSYNKYLQSISNMHMPMNRPIYSDKTNKTFVQKPWF